MFSYCGDELAGFSNSPGYVRSLFHSYCIFKDGTVFHIRLTAKAVLFPVDYGIENTEQESKNFVFLHFLIFDINFKCL